MAHTSLSRPRHRAPILLAALALLAACGDDPVAPAARPSVPPPPTSAQAVDVSAAERAALRQLTRAVAMAMESEGVRQQVKKDMRASRATREHKLHLGDYLTRQGGGVLLAQMTKATGLSRDTLRALVAAVRPLEFYVPVPAQRESWRGTADVIVASAFDDEDLPVGFDVRGTEVKLDLGAPPSAPVVALVPVETNFAAPLDEARLEGRTLRNAGDQGGAAIGTLVIESPGTSAVGASSYVAGVDDGIYLTRTALNDAHESWIKGSPELEVHLHGPRNAANPRYGEDLTCSGEHVIDYRKYFDQNGNSFSAGVGAGAPLLADRYDFNQAQAKFPNGGRFFLLWEDDDTACVIKTDKDMTKILLQAAGVAGIASVAAIIKGGAWRGTVLTAVVSFVITVFSNADFLRTNDDFVGVLVPKADAPNFAGYPGTHVVLEGSTYNGNADIYANWPTAENGRPFMANVATDVQSLELNLGNGRQLSAAVYDQYGGVLSGHPIAWRSDASYVAQVSESGVLSAPNAGTTTVYVRACDPECIDRPIEVRVTGPVLDGPSYLGAGQMGTISGYVVNPRHGSYWYQWSTSYCTNGSLCPSDWYDSGSGWDGPGAINVWLGTYDAWVDVSLSVYAPSGELVGTKNMRVAGPNQWPGCEGTTEINCQPFLTAGTTAGTPQPGAGAKPRVARTGTAKGRVPKP